MALKQHDIAFEHTNDPNKKATYFRFDLFEAAQFERVVSSNARWDL